jgi:hypothetical protein
MALFEGRPPHRVRVAGTDLRCHVCGSFQFRERRAQLNTAGATFLGLGWTNRSAVCYVCAVCGYVHWFLTQD